MKRKYKLLISSIGLFSIGVASIASILSCSSTDSNSNKNSKQNNNNVAKTKNNSNKNSSTNSSSLTNEWISNALTNYFNNSNNQIALINYLINNDFVKYSNDTWNYNTTSSAPNNEGYTSWTSALSSGISEFIANNQNISYAGVLGPSINTNDLSVIDDSYGSSTGLVFTIVYNSVSASSNVIISKSTLNNFIDGNTNVANVLTTYFSSANNQIDLIKYLLKNGYIVYSNGTWSYYDSSNGYSSWNRALNSGISAFIANNRNISYGGILGSNINVGDYYDDYDGDLSITNALYNSTSGLVFKIEYINVGTNGNVTISTSTLNQCNENNNSSSTTVANALTNYFNDTNNQIALINYLLSNDYITYSNGTWSYNTNYYSSWDSALSYGISAFIANNRNISYDGILGSSMNVSDNAGYVGDISVTNASYSSSVGLVFTITYNNVSASSEIAISFDTLNDLIQNNTLIANALTNYFNNSNNQIALINYLLNNGYITYSNGTWSSNINNDYILWASALTNGISAFIANNQNISYDGILGSSMNVIANSDYDGDLLVTNATYNSSTCLEFIISYNGISASDDVKISIITMNNYNENNNESNISIANALTTYFSNSNNQIALINYLLNNNYITYFNGAWDYTVTSLATNNEGYTSWDSALSSGISAFIANNRNISYDGILDSSNNVSDNDNNYNGDLSVTNASYSSSTGLVFSIGYNNVSASSNVTISNTTLNNVINANINISNGLTNYFNNSNNQITLINYLINNEYITYSNGSWSYYDSSEYSQYNYSSWANALTNGISRFISNNQSISYDGILGSSMNVSDNAGYVGDISVTNASYSSSVGLVFTIVYGGVNSSSEITISSTILNNVNNTINTNVSNALTTYFNVTNNQIALINYLLNNDYITYSNGSWNYDSGHYYSSWANALTNGISRFISNNQSISYDGVLYSSINTNNLSVTNVTYNSSTGLVFAIVYGGVNSSSEITISSTTLNNVINTNTNVVSFLTTYFSNTNNQIALINYLLNNDYITYFNDSWNYDSGHYYSSWANALTNGISRFISNNQSISYDGVLGSSIDIYYLSITNASYSSSNGITFSILYKKFSASSEVTISSTILSSIK